MTTLPLLLKSDPNKTGNVRITEHPGAFTKPLLLWKSNKCYVYVCVCARARGSACVCGCWCECTGVGVCLRVCSPTFPTCKAHEPYSLLPLWLRHIFGHHFINGTIFGKKVAEQNMSVFFFFAEQMVSEIFLILKRIQRDSVVNVKTLSYKVLVILIGF